MKRSDQFKGLVWSLVGALSMSNVYIFSKAALTEIHLAQFGFYWFGMGLLWNTIYSWKAGKFKAIREFGKSSIRAIIIIGFLELISTALFFIAINTADNPSVISFLADINPLFVALMGVVFLKERFSVKEALGMVFVLSGAIIISYKGGSSFSDFFIKGSEYIILSVFIYAIATIYAKTKIQQIPPAILSINRVLFLFVFSIILMISFDKSILVPQTAFINLFIGSLLGPFLTGLANYTSLQYIEASKASIIRSTRSLFVLLGAYLYFGSLPLSHQLIGGAFTITGVIIISTARKAPKKLKKSFSLSS